MSEKDGNKFPELKSSLVTKGLDRATHRSLFYAMGWEPKHLRKPLVGVVNSFNELIPGHVHLNPLAQAIKLGVAEAGGTPLEFPSIAICDGIATGHAGMRMPMLSRELIADSIELMVTAHALDAMVLLTNCDKVTPGMLMAAARLNIPTVLISGGPMATGRFQGRDVCYTDLIEAEGQVERGLMSWDELEEFEQSANSGPGACALMGTANCMNILAEALGMTLPDGALTAATSGKRVALARRAGMAVIELLKNNLLPRDIMTREAFENALAVDMAVGGSTNTCLHLPAIAREAGAGAYHRRFQPGGPAYSPSGFVETSWKLLPGGYGPGRGCGRIAKPTGGPRSHPHRLHHRKRQNRGAEHRGPEGGRPQGHPAHG